MKIKVITMALFALTLLAACAPAVTIPPRADNFAFIFQDAPCGPNPVNVLDTATGVLVYTPLGDTSSTTITLQLTDKELEAVYQKAMSIRFFEYPSEFVIPDNKVLGTHAPASTYQLSIMNGEMKNSVSWTDDKMTKPDYKKADQLRELMRLINKIIESHPEVQQLPEPNAACA